MEGASDGGMIIEDWAVIDVACGPIKALAGAPLQEGIFVDGPPCVENWREESVGGRSIVRGRRSPRVVGEKTRFQTFQRICA